MPRSTDSTRKRDWRKRFLTHLALRANVSDAAKAAGVDRTLPYHVRSEEPEFAAAWAEAEAIAVDRLERIAFQRASKTSDTLLIFLLKAHRREKYGDQITVNVLLKAMQQLQALPRADMLKALGYAGSDDEPATEADASEPISP